MGGFTSVVKYLDLIKARQMTQAEADNANVPLTKYTTYKQTREIKKINYDLVFPVVEFDMTPYGVYAGRMAFQFNVTAPTNFFILGATVGSDFDDFNGIGNGILVVKWRIGATVHRYVLAGSQYNGLVGRNMTNFKPYTNQLVPQNFTIEYWLIRARNGNRGAIKLNQLKLKTSLITNPPDANTLGITIQKDAAITLLDLGWELDVQLPVYQFNIVWNDNNNANFSIFNGYDPILGFPEPPVNYQLFVHANQPRLTWTIPDLIGDVIISFSLYRKTTPFTTPMGTVEGDLIATLGPDALSFEDISTDVYYRLIGITFLTTVPYNDVALTQGRFLHQVPIQGTTVNDLVDIGQVVTDSAKNIILIGNFKGKIDFGGTKLTSAGGWDVFVAKYDENLNLLWVKQYGDEFDQFGLSVAVDNTDKIVIAGHFAGSITIGNTTLSEVSVPSFYYSSYDIFVAKLDANGNKLWAKGFGAAGVESCFGVTIDKASINQDVYLAGTYSIPQNTTQLNFGGANLNNQCPQDMFVAKLSGADGSYLWDIHHGTNDGTFSYSVYLNGITIDANGDVAAIGYITGGRINFGDGNRSTVGGSDVWVAKFSKADGACSWSRLIGGIVSDVGRSISVTSSNNFVITGGFSKTADFGNGYSISTPQDYTGIFVAELAGLNGVTLFAKAFGGNYYGEDIGYSINVDMGGNILLCGTVRGSYIDWKINNPTPEQNPKYGDGTLNLFITKLNSAGEYVWDKRILTGATLNYCKAVTTDSDTSVIVAGYIGQGTVNFGGINISGNSDNTGFLVKFTP